MYARGGAAGARLGFAAYPPTYMHCTKNVNLFAALQHATSVSSAARAAAPH
jgi:hypothetical protein